MIHNRLRELIARKERRDRRKWPYRAVSEATGVSTRTLSEYGQNHVARFDSITLAKLVDWLGCSVGDLLIYEPDEDEESEADEPARASAR